MAGITFVKVIAVGPGWNKVLASDGETYTFNGDYNWRSNNPGNIEYGPFAISQGAIGSGKAPPGRARGFAIFPSYEAGQAARTVLQFESSSYRDRTVGAAIARYAPASDNNDVASYVRAVTTAAGVIAETRMSDLTPDQRAKFLAAQQRVEGFKPGKISGEAGKPVSADVVRQFKGTPTPAVDIPTAAPLSPEAPPRRPETVNGVVAPAAPPRRPETVGGVVVPRPSIGSGSTVLTAPATPKAPVEGLIKVVPGRAPAPAAQSSVPALGKTVQQVGQEADNGRLNGYREIQAMGPGTPPAKAGAPVAAPAAKVDEPAAKPAGATRVNVEYLRPDGTARPAQTAGDGAVMPTRNATVLTGGRSLEERNEAVTPKKTGSLPAPAPLTFSRPVYKTVTVLNPAWKAGDALVGGKSIEERDEAAGSISNLAKGSKGGSVSQFIQKRVLVTPAKPVPSAPTTKAPATSKAAVAAPSKASPQPSYTFSGENNAFQPRSVQNSKLQQTGYR